MRALAGLLVGALVAAGPLHAVAPAQAVPTGDPAAATADGGSLPAVPQKPVPPPSLLQQLMPVRVEVPQGSGGARDLSTAVEIVVVLTLLSLIPPLLLSVTCFTRVVIVLSFVRRAMGTTELPPNPVLIGLSLFLTAAVMAPVGKEIHAKAIAPYLDGQLAFAPAAEIASGELKHFLLQHARERDLALFLEMSHEPAPEGPGDTPLTVVVPAFILSELRTAFQMGFVLYLPFLVIDLVVSSILLALGMYMLPPMLISTPLKILLFVLVDGWGLVIHQVWQGLRV
jgi:flagellar biosynthetic protein FliP